MLLLKHGYSSSKVTVPPCKNGKLFKGFKAIVSCPLLATQTAETLIDETIGYIQERPSPVTQSDADWDQVAPYLYIHDKDCDIGNLAQSRISESFPDWNCVDHLGGSIPDPNTLEIQMLVEASGGFLDKEQGAIQITLTSRSAAMSFYKAMVKECGIWKWDVTLDWDATREDLELLATSLSNTAVVHLTVHGHRLQGRTSGTAEHGIRFRPLVALMCSGRVQSICLKGFNNFFSSIGDVDHSLMPSLLELSIDTEISCMDAPERNGLAIIFDSCRQLEELVLSCKTIDPVFKYVKSICTHLPKLTFLNLASRGLCLRIHCADGAIVGAAAEVYSLDEITPEDRRLLQEGYLSEIVWKEPPPSHFVLSPDLRTILCGNPGVMQVEMSVPAKQFSAVVNEFLTVFQLLMIRDTSNSPPMLRRLTLFTQGSADAGGEQSVDEDNGARDDNDVNIAMFVEYQKFHTMANIVVDLEMSPDSSGMSTETTSHVLMRYGSSLRSLITNAHFNDHLALLLDESVHKQGHSMLKALVLNPTGLSYCTLDEIDRVLSYASDLEDFLLQLEQLEDFEQQEKAVRLLEDHGAGLTGLSLSGRHAYTWLLSSGAVDSLSQKLAGSEVMTRQTLPNLKSLSIVFQDSQHIYRENVEWIASMVTAPAPITQIRLEGIVVHLTDWEDIFKAICFSTLLELNVKASNVSRDVLLSLVRCVPSIRSGVPLRTLNLANTPVARREDEGNLDPVVSEYLLGLKKRAPYAKVFI
ncbi:hypothetical protein EC968_005994 [Mortierella alpina]|nr:hypothetical protein EC968_005994 [Mortierella alpina]